MRRYETIVILDPDLSKEGETPFLDRINDLIPQFKGELIEKDDWGTRKLAYDIKKKNRGHYVRFDYCGDGALVQELERLCRIDDKVLKFMTVLLADNTTPDAVRAEIAEKAAKKAQLAQAGPQDTRKSDDDDDDDDDASDEDADEDEEE
ncbi:30S ribosomal protein S6 [Desulfosarcina sp. OttesenSCG-928-B08]|nr:30S ribosomal protein S6 [Desulfosarcina sp. OttesenSCG-928-B08]